MIRKWAHRISPLGAIVIKRGGAWVIFFRVIFFYRGHSRTALLPRDWDSARVYLSCYIVAERCGISGHKTDNLVSAGAPAQDSEEEAINEMAYKKIDFVSIHNKPMSISFI